MASVSSSFIHVFVTGPPGIGKTTAVKKVCEMLKERNIDYQGFITEEVRNDGQRVGFEVSGMSGPRTLFSKVSDGNSPDPRIGKYVVNVPEFERVALPTLNCKVNSILVIDEIGKMELLSYKFKDAVKKAINTSSQRILATVPIARNPIPFVEELKKGENICLIHINKENRDRVPAEILQMLT